MRSPLVSLGCADPVETMGTLHADDPDATALAALLEAWPCDADDMTSYSAADLIKAAQEMIDGEPRRPELLDALLPVAKNRRGMLDAAVLGTWLRDHRDGFAARRKLIREGSETRPRWAVRPA